MWRFDRQLKFSITLHCGMQIMWVATARSLNGSSEPTQTLIERCCATFLTRWIATRRQVKLTRISMNQPGNHGCSYPDPVHEDGTVSVVELAEVYGKAGLPLHALCIEYWNIFPSKCCRYRNDKPKSTVIPCAWCALLCVCFFVGRLCDLHIIL